MDPWKILESHWPFDAELAEVPSLNAAYNLRGDVAFSSTLRPVFFVGDLDANPEYLLVGMKPGLNASSNAAFRMEQQALQEDFEAYSRSRTGYFRSPALNRRHYWPATKAIAALRGEAVPTDPGEFLARHAVQVELLPFFAPHAGLRDSDFLRLRAQSSGGQLAQEVLEALLCWRPWNAVIVRYAQTFRMFCQITGAETSRDKPDFATLAVLGRRIPVYALSGQYVADADIQKLRPRSESGSSGRTPLATTYDHRHAQEPPPDEIFAALEEFIMSLGPDVTRRPRAKQSCAFRRRRNFVTLIPQRGRIDVLTAQGWRDGLSVFRADLAETKTLISKAYALAS